MLQALVPHTFHDIRTITKKANAPCFGSSISASSAQLTIISAVALPTLNDCTCPTTTCCWLLEKYLTSTSSCCTLFSGFVNHHREENTRVAELTKCFRLEVRAQSAGDNARQHGPATGGPLSNITIQEHVWVHLCCHVQP